MVSSEGKGHRMNYGVKVMKAHHRRHRTNIGVDRLDHK